MLNILYKIEDELAGPIPVGGGSPIAAPLFEELEGWKGVKESDPSVRGRLEKYWEPVQIDEWSPSGTPWSAAFVSWVSREGDRGFPSVAAHWQYVDAVVRGDVPGWGAYSILENQGAVPLQVGDILIRPRGSGQSYTKEYWYTHGDIVGAVRDGYAELYGGNLGDTAKLATRIQLAPNGVAEGRIRDYVSILKREKKSGPSALILGALGIVGGVLWTQSKA